jgi:hypothetical protein
MKSILTSLLVLLSVSIFAQFSGYYDPANWTTTNTGCQPGSVDASGAPASVAITSGDNPFGCGSSVVSYSITAVCGSICFDWDYSTVDCNGSYYDRFGYAVNGVPTQLSVDCINCGYNQSGSTCVDVEPGDVFSFYVDAIDTYCGSATATISNFSGPDDVCHDSNGNPKVEICHKGTTLCVAPASVPAHMAHGDYLGPCCSTNEEGLIVDEEEFKIIEEGTYAQIAPRAEVIQLLHASLDQAIPTNIGIVVYPNPASDVVTIRYERMSGPVTISVYSLNGQLMQKTNAVAAHGATTALNIGDLTAGSYEIQIQPQQGKLVSEKLTVSAKN